MSLSKADRLTIFLQRLRDAAPASTAAEARQLLEDTLNGVEDDYTDIPFDPSLWASDGRMYGPRPDSKRSVPSRPDIARYRNKDHNTFIGANGAIRIEKVKGQCFLDKPGKDGRTI